MLDELPPPPPLPPDDESVKIPNIVKWYVKTIKLFPESM